MRLLFTGDLHIGRSSSRIPSSLSNERLRAASAWKRIVDTAIEEQVDVVCLSGDIADKENKFWEAIGPLESGITRLGEAGIETIAVSGNHDYDVLARLADQLPADHFRLIGRRGKWERYTIERDGHPVVHIDGWSFPRERVYKSPLADYDLEPDSSIPILGLVHGDLGVADSVYAPLDAVRLRSLPPHGWLLGHIHAPGLIAAPGEPWLLYPGSPQALDFGEPGIHGPWIVEVERALGTPEQLPMSSVRYARVEIDVSDAEDEAAIEAAIIQQLRSTSQLMIEESAPSIECLSIRMEVIGRTRMSHRVPEITERLVDELALPISGVLVNVDRVRVATLPDIDVAEYAKANSAPGAVARLLMALDEPELPKEVAELVGRTRRELEQVEDHKYFAALDRREITDDLARAYLRDTSKALLTELVAQSP